MSLADNHKKFKAIDSIGDIYLNTVNKNTYKLISKDKQYVTINNTDPKLNSIIKIGFSIFKEFYKKYD